MPENPHLPTKASTNYALIVVVGGQCSLHSNIRDVSRLQHLLLDASLVLEPALQGKNAWGFDDLPWPFEERPCTKKP